MIKRCKDCKRRGYYCLTYKEDDACGLYHRKWWVPIRDLFWRQK